MARAPRIDDRWACIAGADQHILAAQLSSYFREPGQYLAVFEFPTTDQPFREAQQKEDYFSQILGRRAATNINNCLASIQPDSIILLGLSTNDESYLRARLATQGLISINSEHELLALSFTSGQPQPLECKPTQFLEGLIAARMAARPLAFSDTAADVLKHTPARKGGLVVIENRNELTEIIIVNYAASIGAEVLFVEGVGPNEVLHIPRQLQEWSNNRSSQALRETRRKITSRIRGIDFKDYDFATFFTAGLPYGLILENVIPLTHMINGPFTGICIANIINEENKTEPIGNALLFSIDAFPDDEIADIKKKLAANNFLNTSLTGPRATNSNLTYFGAHLPYDLLHICSHGGEIDGYFVKQLFRDVAGHAHTVEYFEVVSFRPSPLGEDNVHCERKVIFATFDGVAWTEQPLGRYPRHVGDDMMHAIGERDAGLERTPTGVPIAMSAHIKCYESFNQGAFDSLGGQTNPIIFNNSCSSSHELATMFLAAGARAYLSTLWNVGSTTAKEAALAFYDSLFKTGKVLDGLSEMLRSINNPKYRDIYILWGLHFSSLRRPATRGDANVIAGLFQGFDVWMDRFGGTKDEQIKTSLRAILKFHVSEITRRVPPERFAEIMTTLPPEREVERSDSGASGLERGEITITSERPRHPEERGSPGQG